MENTAPLEVKKNTGVLLLAALGLVLWSRSKGAFGAIKLPGTTAAGAITAKQAEAMLTSPADLVAANQTFVATHPTAYSMIQQANAQISAGLASAGDIIRFEVDKAYYQKYVAGGGTASYEDFTTLSEHMTSEYKAAIQETKAKITSYEVDNIVEGYLETDAYGNVTGLDEEGITRFLEILTPGGRTYEELAARYPELAAEAHPEPGPAPATEPAPVPQPIYAPPQESVEQIVRDIERAISSGSPTESYTSEAEERGYET